MLRRVMGEKGLSQTEIARRTGVSVSIVSAWVNRTRGGKRGPNREKLERLAEAIGEPRHMVFAAAARPVPGPVTPDRRQAVLEVFAELTEQQQQDKLLEMKALAERNRSGA
jgi:transcriptional regulator with XRE-family HTH domain